jgi:RimJ/RimL family protein N-acetyltransferase
MEVPVLQTSRLILRGFTAEDTGEFSAMLADDDVARFITPDARALDRAEAWRAMATTVGHWVLRGYGFFAVQERASGRLIGRVGPWQPEGWPGLECGWTIAKPWWGRGYAPEAAVAAMRWTFEQFPGLPRIISVIDPQNLASKAVARKVGETRTDEVFDYRGHTLEIWAARRQEWWPRFGNEG